MKKKKSKLALSIFITVFLTTSIIAEVINKINWKNYPSIVEIRNIYNLIESNIKNKKLNTRTKEMEDEETNLKIEKTIIYDKESLVRKYIISMGSDDSILTFNYYYDSFSNLRFVLISGGAVNGTTMEHKIYIDGNREKIWEIQKFTKGPGYPFKENFKIGDLVHKPWEDFKK